MLTETATADGWTDTKSSTDLEKTEELRFLSMEKLRVSKSGDLIGCSVAVTGSRDCVLSNCIFFPVPQQSQHRPGWGMCECNTHSKPACGTAPGAENLGSPLWVQGGAASWAAAPALSRTVFHPMVRNYPSSFWFPGPG